MTENTNKSQEGETEKSPSFLIDISVKMSDTLVHDTNKQTPRLGQLLLEINERKYIASHQGRKNGGNSLFSQITTYESYLQNHLRI